MTRARDLADSQDNLGGAIAPYVSGKNFVINGGFDIWQRGTSFNSIGYTADRWYAVYTGATTVSRQTSGAPVGSQYYLRQTAGGNNTIVDFMQFIETANVIPLQGKVVTLSFKIRRNSTLTQDFGIYFQKNSTVDAGSATAGWTNVSTTQTIANSSIPTGTTASDWYSFSASYTIPNDGTANSLRIILEPIAQVSNGAVFDLAQVQLEQGIVATPFSRAGGSIGGELALCQRYYYNHVNGSSQTISSGWYASATDARGVIKFPVTMRTVATLVVATGTNYYVIETSASGADYFDSFLQARGTVNSSLIYYATGVSGTAGQAGELWAANGGSLISFNAEL